MNVPVEKILQDYVYQRELIEKVAQRKSPASLTICAPNPDWANIYKELEMQIQYALGPVCQYIAHVGSTSVPGLPAKNIIDIDVTVTDAADESTYVPALEAIGFQFFSREPHYYEHRLFLSYSPHANLHVYCTESAEVIRHRIFRDRLRKSLSDRDLYAMAKIRASEATIMAGGKMSEYTERKGCVIREILHRGFEDVGLVVKS
ncbi:hypothetical protein VHEMI01128 [[Torrubiella] hemipterigena]|uniref:GrpB domain protein n=1 Tax=[Torrubiella] hemipterigena TaxID=1531966 RepID=A0A0A1SL07_9HYPO|nr:hypothetical protein VHEMI01128 [[Torrubiella] hemipterigena]